MLRLGAIFIAVCMVLIAASLGAVLYLGLKLDAGLSAVAALAALAVMMITNMIGARLRDRSQLGDQIAELSRGTADLARQVGEITRRLGALESRPAQPARAGSEPLAAEIGELGGLVRQVADTVAVHEAALQKQGLLQAPPAPQAAPAAPPEEKASEAPGLRGLKRAEVAALIAKAMEDNRIDLYLQPIVTLPQRKVRFYEAMARLRTQGGEIVAAEDFIPYAEGAGLLPALDNMMLFRCVAVTRRLQLKNREVGVICNIGAATLADPVEFKKLLQFAEANRALADALSFEFSQAAYRAFGPLEHEALAALAERGFRFSMDHIADLRMEPKELADRRFRFLKVPAALLLDKSASARSDIHPQDLADLLARSGIDVIADRVEHESTVVDLLDYDVRFGQGFLFSPPRPVRAEALQLVAGEAADAAAAAEAPPARAVAAR